MSGGPEPARCNDTFLEHFQMEVLLECVIQSGDKICHMVPQQCISRTHDLIMAPTITIWSLPNTDLSLRTMLWPRLWISPQPLNRSPSTKAHIQHNVQEAPGKLSRGGGCHFPVQYGVLNTKATMRPGQLVWPNAHQLTITA
jgi:hypothetical protein